MFKQLLLLITIVFAFGWLAGSVHSQSTDAYASLWRSERYSPADRLSQDQIQVFSDRVVIKVDSPQWARFADTNSMDPIIDIGANSIEVKPGLPEDIQVGDIISYRSDLDDSLIIHRVVAVSSDKDGVFYTAKGDNNSFRDPEKIRFEQVHGIVIGILY